MTHPTRRPHKLKHKLSPNDRDKAVKLLKNGYTLSEIARVLVKYNIEQIKLALRGK